MVGMGSFTSDDDKTCEPLQAADAAVYEVRRTLNLSLAKREEELRQQFSILADAHVMFIITHANKDALLDIVNTHEPDEPYNEDIRIGL